MTVPHVPIAIIGAGLGGLVAARVLHTRGLEVTVFELEADRHARVQGGMLDIHDDTGQQALRDAGLWEGFEAIIHRGGEAMRILDHTGRVLRDDPDRGDLSRPEVDRGQLRDLLIDALPVGAIRWGHKLTAVRPAPGVPGRWELDLAGKARVTTDLLVGADGAWSRIRPLLTEARPAYTGISFVESDLFDASARHPAEATAIGEGMLFALRGQTGFLGHKEPDGSLHVYLGLKGRRGLDRHDRFHRRRRREARRPRPPAGLDQRLARSDRPCRHLSHPAPHQRSPTWHDVGAGAGCDTARGRRARHEPLRWRGRELALCDGAQLALAVANDPGDVERALTAYEAQLFPRATRIARESADSLEMMFNDESPKALVEMLAALDEPGEPSRATSRAAETATTRA